MSRLQADPPAARRWSRWIVLGCLALGLTFAASSFVAPTFGQAAVEADGGVIHVVQKGETLWNIARRYGVSVDHLVRLNELSDPNRIVAGQKLVIREGEARVHIVQKGETLTSIAKLYGLSVRDLLALNDIPNPDLLSVGQRIVVSPKVQRTHVVMAGDTLWAIARRYEVSVEAIQAANGLTDPRRLQIGQSLVIPAIGGGDDGVAAPAVARVTTQRLSLAWPVRGRLTSTFGPRWGRMHYGIDIAAPVGTPVYAAATGQVTYAGWAGTYGRLIVIDHGNGVETRYAHNSQIFVRVGDEVQPGQRIALVGNTGNSTGPHLHFEVRVNDEPQDPLDWLPAR